MPMSASRRTPGFSSTAWLLALLVGICACQAVGEPVDRLNKLPRLQSVGAVEDRPTVRVVPCAAADNLAYLLEGVSTDDASLCQLAVEQALGGSRAFRLRQDSDAIFDLRIESITVLEGPVATVRIRASIWNTARDQPTGAAIDVEGSERKQPGLARLDLLGLAAVFRDNAPVETVNAMQKALWKLTAKSQTQLL